MSDAQGIFRPSKGETELVNAIEKAFELHAASEYSTFSVDEGKSAVDTLRKRPMVRWFVLRAIKREMAAEGMNTALIDWEAIGDFLVKIAPIIFEIIKMFL